MVAREQEERREGERREERRGGRRRGGEGGEEKGKKRMIHAQLLTHKHISLCLRCGQRVMYPTVLSTIHTVTQSVVSCWRNVGVVGV